MFKEASCRGCAAKLHYTENDVQERHGRDYSGGSDGEEYIVCPQCNNKVILRSW